LRVAVLRARGATDSIVPDRSRYAHGRAVAMPFSLNPPLIVLIASWSAVVIVGFYLLVRAKKTEKNASPSAGATRDDRAQRSALPANALANQAADFGDDLDIRERLHELLRALRECANGNLDYRLPPLGGPLGVLVWQFNCVLDARAESERELLLRNVALESARRRVEDQAAELRRKTVQLKKARLAAELASRAKSHFLANMSHEIRTPMTAILGFADLLLEEESPKALFDHREALETIKRNSCHLLELINDVLDVSKIEASRMTTEQIACSPARIVADVVELMGSKAIEKHLKLRCEYLTPIPETVVSDPTRLKQILFNLVSNAIKFTDVGEVRVEVAAERIDVSQSDKENVRISFTVADTGIGLTIAQSKKLFQPFAQADSSTARKRGGSGLGLAITRTLTRLLGGDVEVVSAPGVGSMFTAHVVAHSVAGASWTITPLALDSHAAGESPLPLAAAKLPELPPCHVLLAEDGPDNQRLLAFLLRRAGARVSIAADGLAAVKLATCRTATAKSNLESQNDVARASIDLILMDMQMPGIDGFEAARRLRQSGFDRPIVALTAHAMTGIREECLAAGCDEYLSKPIDAHQLLETIAAWLGQSSEAIIPLDDSTDSEQSLQSEEAAVAPTRDDATLAVDIVLETC
jgi:signal transduction histidine kinase/DNA-binding response OmpR family regulator